MCKSTLTQKYMAIGFMALTFGFLIRGTQTALIFRDSYKEWKKNELLVYSGKSFVSGDGFH